MNRPGLDECLVSLVAPYSFAAEQYRILRMLIEQMHKDADLRLIAVASAGVGDGKTTTAINLAGSLAQAPETRVLLIDADLRRAALGERLGLDRSGAGLVDVIKDPGRTLPDVVQRCPAFNLSVLPAGPRAAGSFELLRSPRFGELLTEARETYDYVVIDTAPLVPIPDSRLIAKWVEGFLLVVAAHRTPRRLVEEALNALSPAQVIGLVFNNDDRPFFGYYGSYGSYSAYGEASNGHRPRWWKRGSKAPSPSLGWQGRSDRSAS